MKIPRPLIGLAMLGLIVGGVWTSVPQTWTASSQEASPASPWQQLGKGNLEAIQVSDTWMLHSVPTTYLQLLGVQGKKFALLSPTVYPSTDETPHTTPAAIPASLLTLNTPNGHSLKVLKTDKHVFNATTERSRPLADGRLVFADSADDNIWVVDHAGTVHPLLDSKGLTEAKQLADAYWNKGEMYGRVVWAARPQVSTDGKTVLFYSNRDTVKDKFFADNVYAVDVKGGKPRLVFEAKKYKQGVQLVNAVEDTVIGYVGPTNLLLVHHLANQKTTEIPLGGYPTSLSPDERTLLYRKVDDKQVVGRDFYLRDLKSGVEKKAEMPAGYFFNQIGAWSPDGKKFAFYLNGLDRNEPGKRYRTNVLIGVLDSETAQIKVFSPPPASGTLYPLGSLSWQGNRQVVAYATDDTSWLLRIE